MEYNFWKHEPESMKRWAIEKETRRTCFGNPGYIKEWVIYSTHERLEDAEKELTELKSFADPLADENYKLLDRSGFSWNVK